MGVIEVDYEGTEEFLKAELPALLTAVSDLYKQSGVAKKQLSAGSNSEEDVEDIGGGLNLSTTSIATKLKVDSGPNLALAAAARLALGAGKATFTRKEILTEMQSATGYYKDTYRKNLTNSLVSLTKDEKLNKQTDSSYALSPSATQELRKTLVGQEQP